jgi:tRNA A-37 threonylcarbamoyl transferase component Bud32
LYSLQRYIIYFSFLLGNEREGGHDALLRGIEELKLGMGLDNCLTMVSPSVVQFDVEQIHRVPVETFQPKIGETPFLDKSQRQKIIYAKQKIRGYDEHSLIIQVTKKHNIIAGSINCVFINTEEDAWIHAIHEQSMNDLKPDGLISRNGLFLIGAETGGNIRKFFRNNYQKAGTVFNFGKGIWEIRDMYQGILEWKKHFTPADRGKLYSYLQHLSRGDRISRYRGVLYDIDNFLCAECSSGGKIISIVQGKLTSPGSLDFLRTFISYRNHWLRLLDQLCDELDVELHVANKQSSAFLGAGKYGRCFSVKERNGTKVLALKCVLTLGLNNLAEVRTLVSNEFDTLMFLQSKKVPGVVRVVDSSFKVVLENIKNEKKIDLGVGYLMNEVCSSISKEMCRKKSLRKKIGESLAQFHSRDPNPIYHGDARVANAVIDKSGAIIWVDWMYSITKMTRENDLQTLVLSIYGSSILETSAMMHQLKRYFYAPANELCNIMSDIMEIDIPV